MEAERIDETANIIQRLIRLEKTEAEETIPNFADNCAPYCGPIRDITLACNN
jgi:hypothetical protein